MSRRRRLDEKRRLWAEEGNNTLNAKTDMDEKSQMKLTPTRKRLGELQRLRSKEQTKRSEGQEEVQMH